VWPWLKLQLLFLFCLFHHVLFLLILHQAFSITTQSTSSIIKLSLPILVPSVIIFVFLHQFFSEWTIQQQLVLHPRFHVVFRIILFFDALVHVLQHPSFTSLSSFILLITSSIYQLIQEREQQQLMRLSSLLLFSFFLALYAVIHLCRVLLV